MVISFLEKYESEKTWHGRVMVMEIYHLVKCQRDKNWTLKLTSKMFKCSIGLVSENLRLAELIHSHPEITNIETRQEALKKLKHWTG